MCATGDDTTDARQARKQEQEDAAHLLTRTLQMRHEIPDPMTELIGLHSNAYNIDATRGRRNENALPHGLNVAFDDLTQGPQGIRTLQGLNEALAHLAAYAAQHLNTSVTGDPGTWLNYRLQNSVAFLYWTEPDWNTLYNGIRATHRVVRHLAGLTATKIAPCPRCGETITAQQTKTGRSDQGHCYSCNLQIDLTPNSAELPTQVLTALKDPNVSEKAYVTRQELNQIWPGLRASKLRVWVHRGRVHKNVERGTFNLRDVNHCMTTKP